jgi:15-cis-phytoene synthase
MSPDLLQSYDYCTRVARREAKNFYPSFLLLPGDRRRAMCALYAFMRRTDDLADQPGVVEDKRAALRAWRSALAPSLNGHPTSDAWPGWPALADAVGRHGIPTRYLEDVLDGVEMDLEPRLFDSYDELRIYCYRVASAVGLCCLHIWGFRSEGGRAETLAERCGLALQLTNIIRDVREDAATGRVYLPQDEIRAFGVSVDDLTAPGTGQPLRKLLEFEARRAYDDYRSSEPLAGLVAPVGRPMLRAITGIYRALLDEIARRDYDVLARRLSVPAWRKAAITARAFAGRFAPFEPRGVEVPPLR